MEVLINKLTTAYPQFAFVRGLRASWSPAQQQITFSSDTTKESVWTLLHELGHALLDHTNYVSDVSLLQKEAEAWQKAQEVGRQYSVVISDDHIQACLDTYRDWLHRRSTCPHCNAHGIQATQSLYSCLNCQKTWKISSDRFCRPYRLKIALTAK